MDMTQIRYFLALCSEGNFTRAAKRCGIAQPSLTNAIRTLENSLGGALFVRKPRVRLSPFGQMMRPHLEMLWRQFELAHEAAGHYLCDKKVKPAPRRAHKPDTVRQTMSQAYARLRRAS